MNPDSIDPVLGYSPPDSMDRIARNREIRESLNQVYCGGACVFRSYFGNPTPSLILDLMTLIISFSDSTDDFANRILAEC
jgi:hypothetical protein